jgi:hypothetical protein
MSICAVVDLNTNVVVNTIMAEVTDFVPNGYCMIEITPDMSGCVGWTWDGTKFIDPNPIVIDTPGE